MNNMNRLKKSRDSDVINVDPFGSYTGIPINAMDKPVQDADDL